MATTPDVWTDVQQEREALLAQLELLTPPEWDEPSLCDEWRVRDVVDHLVSETTLTIPKVIGGTLRSGLRINRFIARDARRRRSTAIPRLLDDIRSAVPARTHLRGLSSSAMLVDIVIHSLDIRRPRHLLWTVPERRTTLVADDL